MLTPQNCVDYIIEKHHEIVPFYEEELEMYLPDHPREWEDYLYEAIGTTYEEEVKKSFPERKKSASLCAQLMSLASATGRLIEEKKEFEKIFYTIENTLSQLDEDTQGDFEVCFFETIINYISLNEWPSERAKKVLGPISLMICRRNMKAWGIPPVLG